MAAVFVFVPVFLGCTGQSACRTIKLKPIKDARTENAVLDMYRQAKALRKADKNVDARLLLEKAAMYDPTAMSPYLHEELSRIYHDLGNPNKAVDEALLCLKFDPRQKHVLYNLALYCQEANRFDEAIAFLKRYQETVSGEKKAQAASLVALLGEQKEKAQKYSPDTRDYLDQLTAEDMVSRWSRDRFPLKVHIQPTSRVAGFKFIYPKLAKESFVTWYKASQKRVAFTFVDSPEDSDINLEWTDQMLHVGNEKSERLKAGLTTSTTTGEGIIKHARIQVRTVRPFSKEAEPEEKIKETCLHEIGHALGLNGHSTNPGDIMYVGMTRRQLPALTKRDKTTIARLYQAYPQLAMEGVFEAQPVAAEQAPKEPSASTERTAALAPAQIPAQSPAQLPDQAQDQAQDHQDQAQAQAQPPVQPQIPFQPQIPVPFVQAPYAPQTTYPAPVYQQAYGQQPYPQPYPQPYQQPPYYQQAPAPSPYQITAFPPAYPPAYQQPYQQPAFQQPYQQPVNPYNALSSQNLVPQPYQGSPYGYAPPAYPAGYGAPQAAPQAVQPPQTNPLARWASQILGQPQQPNTMGQMGN